MQRGMAACCSEVLDLAAGPTPQVALWPCSAHVSSTENWTLLGPDVRHLGLVLHGPST